jgi:hypothetical protein
MPNDRTIPSSELISLDSVRSRLAAVWLIGGCFIILLVVVQALLGRYEDKPQEAFGWLLPTIMPTLGMIVAVLGYTALDPLLSQSVVRRTFFRVAFWLSTVYLVLVLLTVAIQPLAAADAKKALDLMRMSNLWLGPFQGLVASALGVLFVSKKERPPESGLPNQ